MRLRRIASATCLVLFACASAQTFIPSQTDPNVLVPVSSIPHVGQNHTNYLLLNPRRPGVMRPMTSAPTGYLPSDIRRAYNIPAIGGGEAIAIVDAFDLPSALSDFNTFAAQFNLPQETSLNRTAATNKVFQIVYASGVQPPSGVSNDWGGEIALDIEWAHAMAPSAKIYLVEANSQESADLFGAVKVAANLPEVREVSMSWGAQEDPTELQWDSSFNHPGVVYFVSSGDSSDQQYPSESPYVVSVGGTSLNVNSTGYVQEIGWDGGGGGPSAFELRPAFQNVVQPIVGTSRGDPDCAAVADPNTGVAVYSSQAFAGDWQEIGGTSLACPVTAGITNDREFAENSFAANAAEEEQRIYANLMGGSYRDITAGSAFANCKIGWDYVTGVGTPNGLMPAWGKFGGSVANAGNGANSSAGNSERWADTVGAGIEGSVATGANDVLYFGADDGNVYAVSSIDGSLGWRFATSGAIKTVPAVGPDGTVYVASEDGNLYALNGSTGSIEWKLTAGGSIVSSPAIGADGTLYFGCEDGKVYAVSPKGTKNWTFPGGSQFESSPAIDPNGNIVIGCDNGELLSITNTGSLKWSFQTGGAVKSSPAVGPNGSLLVGSDDGRIYAVNSVTGSVEWNFQTGGPVESSPAVSQSGQIFLGSSDSNLYCLDATNGAQAWKFHTGGPISCPPAVDPNGNVYVGSSDGNLYVLNNNGSQSWFFAIGAPVTSVALGGDGAVYASSLDHKLYAFGGSLFIDFSVTPSLLTAGSTATGSFILPGPAEGGLSVALASSNSATTVPSTVQVLAGQSSASFIVSTSSVPTTEAVTLTAKLLGSSIQTTLTLQPSPFSNFYLSTASLTGGAGLSGVVQLATIAGGSGQAVSISSNNACATVPAQVTVPSGSRGVSFRIQTSAVSQVQMVTIAATIGNSHAIATLTVDPTPLTAFYLSTNAVTGSAGLRGVVRLAEVAGPTGNAVSLVSGNSCVSVPETVTIPAGLAAVSFAISTSAVSSVQTVTITASYGSSSFNANLTVSPFALTGFTISPNKVVGRFGAYGVLRLAGPAGPGGNVITLTSSQPSVIPPSTVTVPAGVAAVSFLIHTSAVSSPLFPFVTATFNKVSIQATLEVIAASISNLTLSPSTVVGGNLIHGVVRLAGPAGPNGNVYAISSSNESATSLPTLTAIVPAGETACSFVVNTLGVTTTQTSTITVTGPNTDFGTQTLTITPASLVHFYFSPPTVKSGSSTVGVLQLNGQAPPGSANITMSSSSNAVMFVPSPLQIFQGTTATTFTEAPAAVKSNTTVTVTATYNGVTLQASVTVTP